jgi:hypothetical protein
MIRYTSLIFSLVLSAVTICNCKSLSQKAEDSIGQPVENKGGDYRLWQIKDGKFYYDGQWKFLKIAKPLRNFADAQAVNQLIKDLDIIKSKGFTNIAINCYWHHFDQNGDGVPDVSLQPLRKLIDEVYQRGMYPSLSVETYSVGGGNIPEGFWTTYPDAEAINAKGEKVRDTEYGFNSKVISIFHEGYRKSAHNFIIQLAKGLDTRKILYFETTVEPQYMGEIDLCYSQSARSEYEKWRAKNGITDAGSEMPKTFPMPQAFIQNKTWNKFRAQFLAKWVSEDAAAYRSVAGKKAYIAVDFLDATENTTRRRNGDPVEFLSGLEGIDIIQVNWHWHMQERKPNQKAYDRVRQVMKDKGRNWVISEHMTFNGSDFMDYDEGKLKEILRNALLQGTKFGWEFVTIGNNSADSFSLYNSDWSPKKPMKAVDDHWKEWMKEIDN